MKRIELPWRLSIWLFGVGWIPVGVQLLLNHFFHIEDRFDWGLLIIPYMEFITMPLTFVAALIALYRIARLR